MNNERQTGPVLRCAVYTRKSSEEGLDQSFNSLDAQREACEAYVLSQRHEGWRTVPTRYDDGGFSGGSMQRPALQALMQDIENGLIDLIVVYKVDRLTRSLSDFAKMVELFDAKKVSFVSVTQQFNTTTSMGRLTLNVLLSFAQFEREVTGERIRDKIAASKKKGMWMGGRVPVGYDAIERRLVVNVEEAKQVKHFFERYLALGCVSALKAELDEHGVVSKVRVGRTGKASGGLPYSRGALYELLRNRVYLGEIKHRTKHYPGQHEAIVPLPLWDKVQAKLTGSSQGERKTRAKEPSMLIGLVVDDQGNRLTPSHTVKNGKRYRYYVSLRGQQPKKRVPAHDLERLVMEQLQVFLNNQQGLLAAVVPGKPNAAEQQALLKSAEALSVTLAGNVASVQHSFIRKTIHNVALNEQRVDIQINCMALRAALRSNANNTESAQTEDADSSQPRFITLSAVAKLARCGLEVRLVVEQEKSKDERLKPSQSLVKAIARGRNWYEQLVSSGRMTLGELAQASSVNDRYTSRILRFAFLAPDIVEAILEGKQPKGMTLEKAFVDMPLGWEKQRQFFGL